MARPAPYRLQPGWVVPAAQLWSSTSVTGSTNDLDPRAHTPIRAPPRGRNGTIRAAPDPGPITDGEAKQPTLTRSVADLALETRCAAVSGSGRFWLALSVWSPSSSCAGGQGAIGRPAQLGDSHYSSQSGMVGSRSGRELDLVVRIGCVCHGERGGQRQRRKTVLVSSPLRECSCLRHDQVPKWTGMRPLIPHRPVPNCSTGFARCLGWYRGVAPALAACARGSIRQRADRRSVPWISGSGDGSAGGSSSASAAFRC